MATKKNSSSSGSGSKYGPKAHEAVEREMKEMKQGKLRSGSGRKVTNPKQAIAIGLSEARREGGKVPPPPKKSAAGKKSSAKKKSAGTKTVSRTSAAKKSSSAKKSGSGSRSKSTGK